MGVWQSPKRVNNFRTLISLLNKLIWALLISSNKSGHCIATSLHLTAELTCILKLYFTFQLFVNICIETNVILKMQERSWVAQTRKILPMFPNSFSPSKTHHTALQSAVLYLPPAVLLCINSKERNIVYCGLSPKRKKLIKFLKELEKQIICLEKHYHLKRQLATKCG